MDFFGLWTHALMDNPQGAKGGFCHINFMTLLGGQEKIFDLILLFKWKEYSLKGMLNTKKHYDAFPPHIDKRI